MLQIWFALLKTLKQLTTRSELKVRHFGNLHCFSIELINFWCFRIDSRCCKNVEESKGKTRSCFISFIDAPVKKSGLFVSNQGHYRCVLFLVSKRRKRGLQVQRQCPGVSFSSQHPNVSTQKRKVMARRLGQGLHWGCNWWEGLGRPSGLQRLHGQCLYGVWH